MAFANGDFFYFGICHLCKKHSENLRRCGNCRSVAYCSKDHQKLDWPNHRDLCKAIILTVNKIGTARDCNYEEWKRYRICLQLSWRTILKRDLKPFECQMWMFPRVCHTCYSRDNLIDCPSCRNVSYCSEQHRLQHKIIHDSFCGKLKLCMNVDLHFAKGNGYPKMGSVDRMNSTTITLPEDMNKLLDLFERETVPDNDRLIQHVLKSDAIAPGATILYAIERSSLVMQPRPSFIIHCVGSSSAEGTADWLLASELILHWTDICDITYVFIGPEVWEMPEDLKLCETCRTRGKILRYRVYRGLYHEVVDDIPKPNLVIAFNAGLHEFAGHDDDLWSKSIPYLVRTFESPFVFTSYTEEESCWDLKCVTDSAKVAVLMCGKNPFGSLRPIRDWCKKDVPVFYSNAYITIVKKTINSRACVVENVISRCKN